MADKRNGLIVPKDAAIADDMAGALMDHLGALDDGNVYQFDVPAAVIEWIEQFVPEYVNSEELGLEPDEEVGDFTTIVFTALFAFLGTLVSNHLVANGFGPHLRKRGARVFLARCATAQLAPGCGLLPRYDGIPAVH